MKEKINLDAVKNKDYKKFWEEVKDYLEANEHVLLGYIANFKGDVFKAYEQIEERNYFKNFNKILARLGDED